MTEPDINHQLAAIRATAATNGHIVRVSSRYNDEWIERCRHCTGYIYGRDAVVLQTDGLDERCPGAEREAGVG